MTDWLVAFDDLLCQRLTCCTLCGRAGMSVLWGICGTLQAVFAYVLCQRCKEQNGVRRVEALLAARYEAGARTGTA